MGTFTYSIQMAFLLFPLVALFFTIPYIIFQYHKYGSVNSYRSIIIYSFLLYLISAYFLVILPLPDFNTVSKMTSPKYNLIPFQFISDIFNSTSFQFSDFATYFPTLKNPVVYEALFNVILTLPFGIYLHYYYECSFKKTIFYSFCFSLFFELTQLTGLYFIYPRGYRVFDVDDLILNTLGGVIGFFIGHLFLKFLPSREEIDAKSIKKGATVSFLKRFFCNLFDFSIVSLFLISSLFLMKNFNLYSHVLFLVYILIILLLYYVLIPSILPGQTIGMKFFHLRFSAKKNIKWYRILNYYFLHLIEYAFVPALLLFGGVVLYLMEFFSKDLFLYYNIMVLAFTMMLYIITGLKRIFRLKTIPEILSGLCLESTIKG